MSAYFDSFNTAGNHSRNQARNWSISRCFSADNGTACGPIFSPRAAVALLLCSKSLSAIRGRDFSTPDDVRDISRPVLRHRLTLRAEAELDGATPDSVISDILQSAEVPR